MDVLTFEVDGLRYALPVSSVREVLRATAIVPLPKAPPVVQGIINIRGELVAVLDLRMRFGAARRPVQADEHFVVVHAGARTVALRADRAVGLLEVDDAALQPVEPVVARTEYVAGLATLADGLVLIVDPAAFLSESEGIALSRALDARDGEVMEAGGETVLLAEDDAALRAVASRILRRNGYQVLEARNGRHALEICGAHSGPVHLLVTDMVMPEMSGFELGEQVAAEHPAMRVLYMSGYSRELLARQGVSRSAANYIEKPFTAEALAAKVREVLDAPPTHHRA